MEKRNDSIDPKTEAISLLKNIVCEGLYTNSIPVHLSEPFNVNVEFLKISSDWLDLELLDKNQIVLEKIKINTITSVDFISAKDNERLTPPSSPMLSRSNSILNGGGSKASSILGLHGSSDDLLSSSSGSKKANMLLGLGSSTGGDDGVAGGSPSSPPPLNSKKASMLLGFDGADSKDKKSNLSTSSSSAMSPKLSLLARSASNNLLNANFKIGSNKEQQQQQQSASGADGNLSSSTSNLTNSVGNSGSNSFLGSSSPSSTSGPVLGVSPSTNSILSSSTSSMSSLEESIGHYNQGFSIATKTITYSFNARQKDQQLCILDSVKFLALGKLHQEASQITFDAIVQSLQLSLLCKAPPVPQLPTSPPPIYQWSNIFK